MLSKAQLKKKIKGIREYVISEVGLSASQIKAAMENAKAFEELLSLREQLAELKALEPFGYIDAVHNWNYINLKSELNTVAFISKTPDGLIRPDYGMALFTAAKPAEVE